MTALNEITPDTLRRLATTEAPAGKVVSLFINLDPAEFGTQPARATEINAVLDEASRLARAEALELGHDERQRLKDDVERVRDHLTKAFDADGARGVAVFCSSPLDLFEVIKLPVPIEHHVAIGDRPYIEPLTRIGPGETWWVVLVNRRIARLLSGRPGELWEVGRVKDDVHGWHDQGGWSQANYQRSVQKEILDHLRHVDEDLQVRLRGNGPVDGLLIGGPPDTLAAFEKILHPDVKRHLEGHVDVDVENATPDEVLAAAEPTLQEIRARRAEQLVERLEQGLATGERAVAGLEDVLLAVVERRVEALLLEPRFHAAGVQCPRCGWLGVTVGAQCPLDGTHTDELDDVVVAAIGATIAQDGRVQELDHPAVRDAGSIAALLRF
jgi:peptide subunit release factor 1 (eRF1)